MDYFGTTGRRLQQGPPGTVPEGVEATQPDAAMSPMSAPGMLKTLTTIGLRSIHENSLLASHSMWFWDDVPHSAAGGLPGPQFQALPEPAPLPPLPRPAPQLQTMPAEAMAAMAPMSAMAGEAQPGAQYQVCTLTVTFPVSLSLRGGLSSC